MHAWMIGWMHEWMDVRMHASMHACTHACMHVCSMYVNMYVYMYTICVYVYVQVYASDTVHAHIRNNDQDQLRLQQPQQQSLGGASQRRILRLVEMRQRKLPGLLFEVSDTIAL